MFITFISIVDSTVVLWHDERFVQMTNDSTVLMKLLFNGFLDIFHRVLVQTAAISCEYLLTSIRPELYSNHPVDLLVNHLNILWSRIGVWSSLADLYFSRLSHLYLSITMKFNNRYRQIISEKWIVDLLLVDWLFFHCQEEYQEQDSTKTKLIKG